MDVKQLLKTTIGKIRMLFAEEEIFYIGGSDVLPPPLEKEQTGGIGVDSCSTKRL